MRLWLAGDAGEPVARLGIERSSSGVGELDVNVAGIGHVRTSPR